MGFPDDAELGTTVELNLGGTWTDVTYAARLAQLITITRGKTDEEATRSDPSKIALQLRNPDGAFSPRNPVGPYYGLLSRNTPLRVRIAPTTVPWLDIQDGEPVVASTPDAAALDVTGDIDIRFDAQLPVWADATVTSGVINLITKYGGLGTRSWFLGITGAGALQFFWSPDGSALSAAVSTVLPFLPDQRGSVRVTLDVNNGASGNTVTFYTSTTPGTSGPWTQLGSPVVQSGITSIFNGTSPLEVGRSVSSPGVGTARRIYGAEVRNGIAGTVVAHPDFTAQAEGTTAFTDSAGRAWSVTPRAITFREVRGIGEVPEWPPRWGTSGKLVTATLAPAGIGRRLGQGQSALASTLRRRIPSDPNLLAYWPMEDGSTSLQAYSPLPSVKPMTTNGLTFGADDSLAGSSALPTLGAASSMQGSVPSSSTGAWRLEMVYRLDTLPAGDFNAQFIIVNTSTAQWRVGIGAAELHFDVTDLNGTSLYANTALPTDFSGSWSRFILRAQQSGGNVAFQYAWVTIGGGGRAIDDSFTGTVGHVTRVAASHGSALQGMPVGHVAVFGAYDSSIFNSADLGFAGEAAGARINRLTTEEQVPLRLPYGTFGTALGAQRPDTLLNLCQQSSDADEGGILYEPRDAIALAYRTRASLYNQTPRLVLDYARGQVAPPLEPSDGDDDTKNDVTVQRTGGSLGTATLDEGPMSTADPTEGGVGRYPDAVTENLANDDQPAYHAGWRLHLGTFDGMRFPVVTVYLHHSPELIAAARTIDIGDRIQILNPPVWLPPGTIDLLVQGVTEVVGVRTWTMSFNCVPAGPWSVAVLDDPVLGRVDTDGSQLLASVSSSASQFRVQATAGPRWTTDPAEYPFDLTVGGEVVTATAAAPDLSDAFGRTASSSWGSADTGQAWATSGGSASDYSVSSGAGRILLSSVNVARLVTVSQSIADFDLTVTVSTTALAAGASQFVALVGRMVDGNSLYSARLEFTTAAAVALTVRRRLTGTETQLAGGTVSGLTHTANGQFKVRFQGDGTALRARVWAAASSEPPVWQATAVDASFTMAGLVGVRTLLNTGNTNSSPSAVVDDLANAIPQRLTVIRSVNGVTKPQTAGTDIRLANPMILAL